MNTVERMALVVVVAITHSAAHGSINAPQAAHRLERNQSSSVPRAVEMSSVTETISSLAVRLPTYPFTPALLLVQLVGTICQTPEGSCELNTTMPMNVECTCSERGSHGYVSTFTGAATEPHDAEEQDDSKSDTEDSPNAGKDKSNSMPSSVQQNKSGEDWSNSESVSENGKTSGKDK